MKTSLALLSLCGLAASALAADSPSITLRVAPERDVVYSGGSPEVLVQIEIEGRKAEGLRRSPMNLALVLDRSGSMEGAKIEKAKQAASAAIDRLGPEDYVSLVSYNTNPELLFHPQHAATERERDALKELINKIRPTGGTGIYAGVKLGAEQLRKQIAMERVNRIVLLSDGIANAGPSKPSDLASLGTSLRGEGLSVTTIGLGDDYNEDLMTALAESSNANYYYVQDAEKLPGIFAEELGAARTKLARSITIKITAPEGVKIREILGRPDIRCGDRTAEITLPEYFGSDKRRFIVRCLVEKEQAEPLDVASVSLNYEEIESGKITDDRKTAKVKFSGELKDSDASIRSEVAQEVSIISNREDKEKAVKLADEGKPAEAEAVLRTRILANAAAPAAAQLPNMAEENSKLESSAAEVARAGSLSKASRKQIQYDNWKAKYQKQ